MRTLEIYSQVGAWRKSQFDKDQMVLFPKDHRGEQRKLTGQGIVHDYIEETMITDSRDSGRSHLQATDLSQLLTQATGL
jgi:hypothetical protein